MYPYINFVCFRQINVRFEDDPWLDLVADILSQLVVDVLHPLIEGVINMFIESVAEEVVELFNEGLFNFLHPNSSTTIEDMFYKKMERRIKLIH